MMMAATLSSTGRVAQRIPAARPATLRNAFRQPIDIFIENLSAVGFGMSTTADLRLGSLVSLQLAGIERRDARVVRRLGLSYGCEFVLPLAAWELTRALDASAVLNGQFPTEESATQSRSAPRVHPLKRVAVLLSINLGLWTTILFGAHALLT